MRWGAGLKGAAARRAQATQALEGASSASDRSAQRACARLAAGALEVFGVDSESTIYKRAAGALEAFVADLRQLIYKRVAGPSEVFTASSIAYKQPATEPRVCL